LTMRETCAAEHALRAQPVLRYCAKVGPEVLLISADLRLA
jgi:hypothetical protein